MKSFYEVVLLLFCGLNISFASASSATKHCSSLLFATELEAVKAASDIYNPLSIREDREYMGTIFESAGKFGYTVSASARREDRWSLSIAAMDWDRIRAFWHTHGNASPQHRYFSDSDTRSVQKFGKPLYLADYTGYLKVYRSAGKTLSPYAAAKLSLPMKNGFAVGEFVRDKFNRLVTTNVRSKTVRS